MQNFIQSIMIVIPIIFVLFFGFFAGKSQAFGKETNPIPIINELALKFALPPALFVGTITVSKQALLNDLVLFFALSLVIVVVYLIGFFIARLIFKRNIIESAIAGLAAGCSAGPFYGPAVLGSIFGSESDIAVSVIAIALNIFLIPLATININIELSKRNSQHSSVIHLILQSLYSAIFKTPFVWAPLLACLLVMLDVRMPDVILNSLNLIGKATAGIAVFVAGMTIAASKFKLSLEVCIFSIFKNIAFPILFVIFSIFIFKIPKTESVFKEGLLLAALPSAPLVVLLATKYQQYQQQASSILAMSTVGMLITLPIFILLMN